MCAGLHVNNQLFFSDFNKIWILSTDFQQIKPILYFTKFLPVEAEFFHADGQTNRRTDMTKLTVAFRNFPKALKNFFTSIGPVRNVALIQSCEGVVWHSIDYTGYFSLMKTIGFMGKIGSDPLIA
jgi:hypothetical protein